MKLGLGTAQFGLDYGVTNDAGRVDEDCAARILERAAQAEIGVIDTAPAYGEAEALLGRVLAPEAPFRIVTKTRSQILRLDQIESDLAQSLKRLKRTSIDGLLVHNADALFSPGADGLWAALDQVKERGLVRKIGVSVYEMDTLGALLRRYPLDLVQLPFSVLDQRPQSSGALEDLAAGGIEVHARSLLLQGTILATPDDLPPQIEALAPGISRIRDVAGNVGTTPLALAIACARLVGRIDVALFGVTSLTELDEIIAAMAEPVPAIDFSALAIEDEALIDPRRWTSAGVRPRDEYPGATAEMTL